jgi:hypothetical protein
MRPWGGGVRGHGCLRGLFRESHRGTPHGAVYHMVELCTRNLMALEKPASLYALLAAKVIEHSCGQVMGGWRQASTSTHPPGIVCPLC